ncbi:predicted protein [Plenodomus lingam JN3]|uniref:Predicted protein n=1 Tax=Leptosphaeria maculans (strain JN3 / isolate v23.1.3 / race Av1-4-5-6-7-8) TaxID=985895 RepID=E5A9T7_LEPMJ|nr:predicted protein [Plenodomus lingam JN3]CBY00428.1 predicted protein [Plenodomus lingam JN3]
MVFVFSPGLYLADRCLDTLYTVASFLVQSKFYKPLYAYVSPNLTRYYWASVGMCGVGFFFTLIITIVLCPHPEYCRHTALQDTLPWEITLSTLDILTDLLVISIPVSLACLANFTLSNAIINTLFKSLSVFPIIITVCRTIFQINKEKRQINYLILALWLAIEAAVAVIMGSVSSYRTVVLKLYATHIRQQRSDPTQSGEWKRSSFSAETDTGCEYGHYSPLKHVLAYTMTRRVMHIVIAQRLKIEKIALDRSDMDITLRLTISEHRFPV